MAIVKVDYTRSRAKIKATFRYNAHRRGKDGEKLSRLSFGWDGEIEKLDAYEMIDNAEKGTIFFRFKISPDPKKENSQKDLDLWTLTRQVMLKLQGIKRQDIQFIATEHNDHTDIPHIHAIVLLKGKIFNEDIKVLRQTATQQALLQRRARDLVQHHQQKRDYLQRSIDRLSVSRRSSRSIGMAGGIARRTREPHITPRRFCSCGLVISMKRVREGKDKCFKCGLKQEQSMGLSL